MVILTRFLRALFGASPQPALCRGCAGTMRRAETDWNSTILSYDSFR